MGRVGVIAPVLAMCGLLATAALPPLVVAEVLYGLQERTRADVKTTQVYFRPYCDLLRREGAASIADVAMTAKPQYQVELEGSFLRSVRRLEMTPETERRKDEWDLFAFGHRGSLSFTGVSQPWLREAVKRLALDAGEPVPLAPKTIADGLAAPVVGTRTLEIIRSHVSDVVLVSEADIVEGMRFLAERAKLVVEPGGAAATGALLSGVVKVRPGERVVSILSGGNVDRVRFAELVSASPP